MYSRCVWFESLVQSKIGANLGVRIYEFTPLRLTDLQKKILRLIVTDFFCWIPLCIIAFAKLAGENISDNAYVFAAIFLLPINSAINPLLYSDLPDFLYRTIKNKLGSETSSGDGDVSKQISSNQERRITDSTYVLNERRNKSNNSNKIDGKRNPACQRWKLDQQLARGLVERLRDSNPVSTYCIVNW